MAAVAITTDTSALTAIGNDYGYERVFERQVLGLGRPGDVFLAISSQRSARDRPRPPQGAHNRRVYRSHTGGEMKARCDLCLCAPADATPLIEQIHITARHIICGLVEERLFPRAGRVEDFRRVAE